VVVGVGAAFLLILFSRVRRHDRGIDNLNCKEAAVMIGIMIFVIGILIFTRNAF
jgi:hypothetical protein